MLIRNRYQKSLLKSIFLLLALLLLASAVYSYEADLLESNLITATNVIIPVTLIVLCGVLGAITIRRYPLMLWTPAVMFLGHTLVFKGFGPLIHVFGDDLAIDRIQRRFLALSDHELLATHSLNLVATIAVFAGLIYSTGRMGSNIQSRSTMIWMRKIDVNPIKVAVWLLVIGAFVKYFFLFPYKFGASNYVLPGSIAQLGQLTNLGIALFAYIAVSRNDSRFRLVFWVLFTINLSFSFLEFYKSVVVLAILPSAIATFIAHRDRRKLITWIAITAFFFAITSPLVNHGRGAISSSSGTINRATLGERIEIIHDYLTGNEQRYNARQGEQAAWARLSYAGQQAYAMREAERGNTFDSVSNIWIVFIPRAIWPNKPVGIGPGKAFYEYATGRDSSRVGITAYADAYWNFGWTGVGVIGFLIGIFFGKITEIAYYWLRTEQFVYYPLIFLTMDMAMRGLNGWLINGVVAKIPLFVAYLIIIQLGWRLRAR